MSVSKMFIPKDDQALPDNYTITIDYIDGKSETIECVYHILKDQFLEVRGVDDMYRWIITTNIKKVSFDLQFTKIVEIKSKEKKI